MPRIHATQALFSYPAWSHSAVNPHRSCRNPWTACPHGRSCRFPTRRRETHPWAVRRFSTGVRTEACFRFVVLVRELSQRKPTPIQQKWEWQKESSDEPTQAFAPTLLPKIGPNHSASSEYPLNPPNMMGRLSQSTAQNATRVWKRAYCKYTGRRRTVKRR